MSEPLPPGNAADPKQVRAAAQRSRDARVVAREDLRAVLRSPQGRRALWRLLEDFGAFRTTFRPDPYTTAFQAGRQDCAHQLMALIEQADSAALFDMMREAREWKDRETRTLQAERLTASKEE